MTWAHVHMPDGCCKGAVDGEGEADSEGDGEGDGEGEGEGEGDCHRWPQSVQSVPSEHDDHSVPGPPSSQSPSNAQLHVSVHVAAARGARSAVRAKMLAFITPKEAVSEKTVDD